MSTEEQIPTCQCNQLQIVKKGFCGLNSVIAFLVFSAISYFLIQSILSNQQTIDSIDSKDGLGIPNHLTENIWLFIGCSMALTLSFFAGTIDMNNLYSVCPKCGKVERLPKNAK